MKALEDPAAAPVVVTPDLKAQARPIVVRNQVVAYAVPIEQPNLTPVDATYQSHEMIRQQAARLEELRLVAAQLAAGTRESDILARYGGEEFVMAFPETPLREAAATCERIRRRIQDDAWENVRTGLRVTMTIGLDGDAGRGSVELMLQAADARLYEGKQNGRNRVCGIPEVAAS